MRFILGIDGGGTRTRAALSDQTGQVVGIGVAGPSNYGATPIETVQENISRAVHLAFQQDGNSNPQIEAMFLGVAGVVTETDRESIRNTVADLHLAPINCIGVDHDIRVALAGGLCGREGIALIAGTGSSCYGRLSDGRSWQAGGWAHLADDAGSGYDLVVRALKASVRAADGRGPKTALKQVMFDALKINELPEIIRRLHYEGFSGPGKPMSKSEIASLAPLVIATANGRDAIAQEIIECGVKQLAVMVETVANKLEFGPSGPEVALAGSIALCPSIATLLREVIRQKVPNVRFAEVVLSPVLGAVLLAMKQAEIEINHPIIQQLSKAKQGEL